MGPVDPPFNLLEKATSKILRLIHMKANFAALSENRLNRIAREVKCRSSKADYQLFWGQMPWLHCRPEGPYGVYLDAPFRTYLSIYVGSRQFREKDIARIEHQEAQFLAGAKHVFWGSQWAFDSARYYKAMNSRNNHVVYIGGNLEVPSHDSYSGNKLFLFAALRFLEKGGMVTFEAFKKVYSLDSSVRLMILGEQPPSKVLEHPGVEYIGLLRKNIPEQLAQYTKILSSAFCIVHPTTMDTLAMVLLEAGYGGCPAIVSNSFGIPELVRHQDTGLVIDPPVSADEVATCMLWMLNHPEDYLRMRNRVRSHTVGSFTFDSMVTKMYNLLSQDVD